jgi:DNA processing protein
MDTYNILTMLSTPKVGRKTTKKLLDVSDFNPSSISELRDLFFEAKRHASWISVPDIEDIRKGSEKADLIIEDCDRQAIKIIAFNSPEYPTKLKNIPDTPIVLYAKGNTEALRQDNAIAIIGTREPTPFGQRCAERFGSIFAGESFVVVSGLALGCDTAAHTGCLNAGGITVAILAHGLDTVYPAKNKGLAKKILEEDGCLLSEYSPGTRGRPEYFIERDRLQSGISDAVLVVETDVKGGTMHTVKFSIEQQRWLAALSHPKGYEQYSKTLGNRQLIQEGKADPLTNEQDLKKFISLIRSGQKNSVSSERSTGQQADSPSQLAIPFDF